MAEDIRNFVLITEPRTIKCSFQIVTLKSFKSILHNFVVHTPIVQPQFLKVK